MARQGLHYCSTYHRRHVVRSPRMRLLGTHDVDHGPRRGRRSSRSLLGTVANCWRAEGQGLTDALETLSDTFILGEGRVTASYFNSHHLDYHVLSMVDRRLPSKVLCQSVTAHPRRFVAITPPFYLRHNLLYESILSIPCGPEPNISLHIDFAGLSYQQLSRSVIQSFPTSLLS